MTYIKNKCKIFLYSYIKEGFVKEKQGHVESSQANAVETVLQKADIQNYYTSTTVDFRIVSLSGKKLKENEIAYSMDCMHDELSK